MKNTRMFPFAAALAGLLLGATTGAAGPAPVRCELALDREAVPAGSAQTVVIQVALDAPEYGAR